MNVSNRKKDTGADTAHNAQHKARTKGVAMDKSNTALPDSNNFKNRRPTERHVLVAVIFTLLVTGPALMAVADVVHNDDVIIMGSTCVGLHCTPGYSFGYNTLVLKENNLRLYFDDSSPYNANNFPTNDWAIIVNDSTSGGDNYFAIQDATAVRNIFRVDAGAPANSIRVYTNGAITLGDSLRTLGNPWGDVYLGRSGFDSYIFVGEAGHEGLIRHVRAGIAPTDAVNYGQLTAAFDQLSAASAWLSTTGTSGSTATGTGSIAIGSGASARSYDTAVGHNSTITADNSTAVGANTTINSPNSVAVGANAVVEAQAPGSTAVGQNARVTAGAAGSVALGSNSVATEPNTVSVGSPGSERRITNVADGVNPTDAVNMNQLTATNKKVAVNSNRISQNSDRIEQNSGAIRELDRSVNELRDESRAGIAAAAALVELMPSAPGKTTLNVGTASFHGAFALGITAVHRLKAADCMLNTGISFTDDEVLVRAGASWEF